MTSQLLLNHLRRSPWQDGCLIMYCSLAVALSVTSPSIYLANGGTLHDTCKGSAKYQGLVAVTRLPG